MMIHRVSRPVFIAVVLLAVGLPAAAQQPIRGFPADLLPAQLEREQLVRSVPDPDTLDMRMRLLSEQPHEAGTERSRHVAELILERFRSVGLDAGIEEFEALMPRPVSRTLELVAPERYTAKLEEPPVPGDKDSDDPNQLPTYNAYSPDGDVTAELVFANYGLPEDYEVLDSLGISVEGKIVIVKYGRSWRGIKPKVAAEHGAIATIIYSDPEDDGYYVNDVYPEGPMRPRHGVQRGSVMDMPTYPGDPQSPGWASVEGAHKLPIDEVRTLSPIPVLPISYGDAQPLLENLGGPVAPEAWRGALPITYHVGPGPARVHLALEFDWEVRPVYNVIARIPGARSPDQWVIWGNHHDAWVNGARDPISGMITVEEAARAFGALLETGWRPARTIILAAWDAEEWGLIGSTEWAEQHQDELREKAVAYLNSDSNSEGWLSAAGSHSLERFMAQVARDIEDPNSGESVLAAWLERRAEGDEAPGEPADTAPPAPSETEGERFTIGALGSGSDYTAFLDFLGLAAVNASYGGASEWGAYHSIYDSYDLYTRFLDPGFEYGVAEAQTLATAVLRLADAPVLPFEFTNVVRTYREYVEEIEEAAAENETTAALELPDVRAALDQLERAADRFERAYADVEELTAEEVEARWDALEPVNELLYTTERLLTDPAGLEHREWFKHLIYAPGFYTGYGVKTMPGIREAVEDIPDLAVAEREAVRVAEALEAYAARVDQAAAELEEALR